MLPEAVQNLTLTYDDQTDIFLLTWFDQLNINDINLTYSITYNISGGGVVLASEAINLMIMNMSSTSFEYHILAGGFAYDGVSVSGTVQACNAFGLGVPVMVSTSLTGGTL